MILTILMTMWIYQLPNYPMTTTEHAVQDKSLPLKTLHVELVLRTIPRLRVYVSYLDPYPISMRR